MNRRFGRERGFNFIEMMITVAIVAILAAIALPAYQESVTRGRIIDATVRMGDFRAQQEKWFLDYRTYQRVPAAGTACGVADPPVAPKDPFQVTCDAPTATTYTITATGRAAGGMSSSYVYTVDQGNTRTSIGPGGTYNGSGCWAVRKDGTCQ